MAAGAGCGPRSAMCVSALLVVLLCLCGLIGFSADATLVASYTPPAAASTMSEPDAARAMELTLLLPHVIVFFVCVAKMLASEPAKVGRLSVRAVAVVLLVVGLEASAERYIAYTWEDVFSKIEVLESMTMATAASLMPLAGVTVFGHILRGVSNRRSQEPACSYEARSSTFRAAFCALVSLLLFVVAVCCSANSNSLLRPWPMALRSIIPLLLELTPSWWLVDRRAARVARSKRAASRWLRRAADAVDDTLWELELAVESRPATIAAGRAAIVITVLVFMFRSSLTSFANLSTAVVAVVVASTLSRLLQSMLFQFLVSVRMQRWAFAAACTAPSIGLVAFAAVQNSTGKAAISLAGFFPVGISWMPLAPGTYPGASPSATAAFVGLCTLAATAMLVLARNRREPAWALSTHTALWSQPVVFASSFGAGPSMLLVRQPSYARKADSAESQRYLVERDMRDPAVDDAQRTAWRTMSANCLHLQGVSAAAPATASALPAVFTFQTPAAAAAMEHHWLKRVAHALAATARSATAAVFHHIMNTTMYREDLAEIVTTLRSYLRLLQSGMMRPEVDDDALGGAWSWEINIFFDQSSADVDAGLNRNEAAALDSFAAVPDGLTGAALADWLRARELRERFEAAGRATAASRPGAVRVMPNAMAGIIFNAFKTVFGDEAHAALMASAARSPTGTTFTVYFARSLMPRTPGSDEPIDLPPVRFCVHLKEHLRTVFPGKLSSIALETILARRRLQQLNEALGPGAPVLTSDRIFVHMTDADVEFEPRAADLLGRTLLAGGPMMGGVCGRIIAQGSGGTFGLIPMQRHVYAFSQHVSKAAESSIGFVQCLPGCFSLFRLSALVSVFDRISKSPTTAHEFMCLMLEEDRYLSVHMRMNGYMMQYASDAIVYTHAPEGFAELLAQQRRWINSTIHVVKDSLLMMAILDAEYAQMKREAQELLAHENALVAMPATPSSPQRLRRRAGHSTAAGATPTSFPAYQAAAASASDDDSGSGAGAASSVAVSEASAPAVVDLALEAKQQRVFMAKHAPQFGSFNVLEKYYTVLSYFGGYFGPVFVMLGMASSLIYWWGDSITAGSAVGGVLIAGLGPLAMIGFKALTILGDTDKWYGAWLRQPEKRLRLWEVRIALAATFYECILFVIGFGTMVGQTLQEPTGVAAVQVYLYLLMVAGPLLVYVEDFSLTQSVGALASFFCFMPFLYMTQPLYALLNAHDGGWGTRMLLEDALAADSDAQRYRMCETITRWLCCSAADSSEGKQARAVGALESALGKLRGLGRAVTDAAARFQSAQTAATTAAAAAQTATAALPAAGAAALPETPLASTSTTTADADTPNAQLRLVWFARQLQAAARAYAQQLIAVDRALRTCADLGASAADAALASIRATDAAEAINQAASVKQASTQAGAALAAQPSAADAWAQHVSTLHLPVSVPSSPAGADDVPADATVPVRISNVVPHFNELVSLFDTNGGPFFQRIVRVDGTVKEGKDYDKAAIDADLKSTRNTNLFATSIIFACAGVLIVVLSLVRVGATSQPLVGWFAIVVYGLMYTLTIIAMLRHRYTTLQLRVAIGVHAWSAGSEVQPQPAQPVPVAAHLATVAGALHGTGSWRSPFSRSGGAASQGEGQHLLPRDRPRVAA